MKPLDDPDPSPRAAVGWWRALSALLTGAAAAQALPLLLGPLLARQYGPDLWGAYAVFAAVAANLAVVACVRYEFALPLARGGAEARALLALCLRLLLASTTLAALVAAGLLAWGAGLGGLHDPPSAVTSLGAGWWALPAAVFALGAVSVGSLWASRAQRFGSLAASRVVQHGAGAVLQAAAGIVAAGVAGLVAGPIVATVVALAWLAQPAPAGGWRALWQVPRAAVVAVARRHRDFPRLNTPHAFLGALQDTATILLVAAWAGETAAGFWGLALRYLKAPATLVGGAVSQVLYPKLVGSSREAAQRQLRRVVGGLAALALLWCGLLVAAGPSLFAWAFGERWRDAGELARALAPYIGAHFVASPLGVVTLAWRAQAAALRIALAGQVVFLAALAVGLRSGGLVAAGWTVSALMVPFFLAYVGWVLRRAPPPDDRPAAPADNAAAGRSVMPGP